MKALGVSLENDVHTGGIVNFLHLAEENGYEAKFLGPAVPVERAIRSIKEEDPALVAISYRLTSENARKVLEEFKAAVERDGLRGRRFVFGGTPSCAKEAAAVGLFDAVFDGSQPAQEIASWLRGEAAILGKEAYAHTLLERIEQRYPWPLLRHHFGVPSVEDTIRGAREIAETRVLDVLSIAPDQNAQEFFFHPERMRHELDGAGGVMVRTPGDLQRIFEATRTGNYPLLRCYSGTNDLLKWAAMLHDTVRIAWGAVPLFWYSRLDGRSERPLEASIGENREAMAWYASKGIPVEVNDSHQWSLRDAPDAVVQQSTGHVTSDGPCEDGGEDRTHRGPPGLVVHRIPGGSERIELPAPGHGPGEGPHRLINPHDDGDPSAHRPRGRLHRGEFSRRVEGTHRIVQDCPGRDSQRGPRTAGPDERRDGPRATR